MFEIHPDPLDGCVSASRPLMSFGELNNNMIKGLMLYLRYHEQRFICVSICVLTHESKNQIKESSLLKVKHVVIRNEKQVFMQCWYMVSIHGLTYLKNIWDIKLLKVLLQGFMELNKKRRHTLMCYILVLYWEACNAWNIIIKSWLQNKTSTSWRKDRNKCSCITWWFLNMACQNKACLV